MDEYDSNMDLNITLNEDEQISKEQNFAVASILLLFAVLGTFGNGLVIISICLRRKLWKATNIYILSLALADFVLALIVMPFEAYTLYVRYVPRGCSLIGVLDFIMLVTSVISVVAISTNRFLLVFFLPHTYLKYFSKTRTAFSIILIWVISILISIPLLSDIIPSGYDAVLGFCVGIPSINHWDPKCSVYLTILSLTLGIPSVLTLLFSYIGIWCIFKKKTLPKVTEVRLYTTQTSTDKKKSARFRNRGFIISRNLCILTIVFAVCWVPTIIINASKRIYLSAGKGVITFSYLLCFANSVINPFLYVMNEQFRKSYKALLSCGCAQCSSIAQRTSFSNLDSAFTSGRCNSVKQNTSSV